MKFGLSFLPDSNGQDLTAVEYFKIALKMSALADEARLTTIKITEHYLHPYGGFCPDPITFLAAVAAVTKQIRLMTGCILPTFHHPLQIAAKTAMLDAISNGRLDVGFARAYLPHEFNAFQISLDGSREIFEKNIEAVIKLWTENNVSVCTPLHNMQNVTNYPQPVQRPHPPVWGAAVMSRQSFAWLGEKGFNLLVTPPLDGLKHLNDKLTVYLESFLQHHPDKQFAITLSMPLLIDENEAKAIEHSEIYLHKYLTVWRNAVESWRNHSSIDYLGYSHLQNILRALTPQKMREGLQAIVGTPERVIDYINQIAQMPIDQIIWQIDFGAQPEKITRKTLDLFIEKVMPRFQCAVRKQYA